ncbi:MAG: DUF4395 family protein [Proteobacteria bacterium]|nr:DUF4395 family protein [Pseudomonadota bacterium]
MKAYVLAPFAVIVLWLGLSSAWMAQTGTTWASDAATTDSPAVTPEPAVAEEPPLPQGPVMIDLSRPVPLGPVMTDLLPAPAAATAMEVPAAAAPSTVMPTASAEATLVRLQAIEARFSAALTALEPQGGAGLQGAAAPSFPAQFVTVVGSAPVIGFLLMLLLSLAVAARGQPLADRAPVRRLKATLHRLTAPDAAEGMLPDAVLVEPGPTRQRRIYGQTITHIQPNGQPLHAGVFNENQVRAAAGLTLALGAVAFAYAALGKVYGPIQTVTTLFFVEFLIRVTWGITRSPLGMVAGWMTRRETPHWVSAKPKRFAWSLGVVMSLAMMIITNSGIRGPLPLTICLICLTLMWLEAVLGLCLGCEIHRQLVRLGWMQPDKDFEICSNGTCTVQPQPLFAR